jgi:hypothetical protein
MSHASVPDHVNPLQWHQCVGYARQACARIFRDGGGPRDALRVFNISTGAAADWSQAVELIAQALCAPRLSRAA